MQRCRLGSFLYQRVMAAGKDDRFDHIKPYLLRFLNVRSRKVRKRALNLRKKEPILQCT
jgi:hypothetical protein